MQFHSNAAPLLSPGESPNLPNRTQTPNSAHSRWTKLLWKLSIRANEPNIHSMNQKDLHADSSSDRWNSPVVLRVSVSALGWDTDVGLLDSWATVATNNRGWRDGNWRSLSHSNAQFPRRMRAGHRRVALNFNRHSEWKRSVSGEPPPQVRAALLLSLLFTGTLFLTVTKKERVEKKNPHKINK